MSEMEVAENMTHRSLPLRCLICGFVFMILNVGCSCVRVGMMGSSLKTVPVPLVSFIVAKRNHENLPIRAIHPSCARGATAGLYWRGCAGVAAAAAALLLMPPLCYKHDDSRVLHVAGPVQPPVW